jgi:hypothetical protein
MQHKVPVADDSKLARMVIASALLLYIDFNIKKRDVHGFIALLMDLPFIAALKKIVHDFISGVEKQPSGHVG